MLLSIIIPYYNADAWIGTMLESLLDQDLAPDDYEIIVVDDESPQEPVVLKDYASRYPQVAYHRVAHGGQAMARNYGLSVAKGDWIYFCDSDDLVQPQVFGGIIRAAQERDLEMVLAHIVKLNENDPLPSAPRRYFSKMSATMTGLEYLVKPPDIFSWGVWAYLTLRSVYQDYGLVFEDVNYVEDRLFKFALLQKVARCATIDVDLYYYIQHETSVFHAGRKRNNPQFIDAIFRYVDQLTELAGKPETTPQLAAALNRRREFVAFLLLTNAFLYSPIEVNKALIDRLASMGLYPVRIFYDKDSRRNRIIKRLMNRRGLWLFLYRVFHLLPDSYIQKHYNA
ncbi:MAG: glycosyltransferase family 2 protein [Bacteroidales bacterium]|nr:glycosyltransferase family 2 protein [Bacteroidales bacterium]